MRYYFMLMCVHVVHIYIYTEEEVWGLLNAAVSYPLTSDYTQAKPDLEYITQE